MQKELKQLKSLKSHGIEVSIPSDSLQVWEAIVPGPDDSPYKGTCILIKHNVRGLIHALFLSHIFLCITQGKVFNHLTQQYDSLKGCLVVHELVIFTQPISLIRFTRSVLKFKRLYNNNSKDSSCFYISSRDTVSL